MKQITKEKEQEEKKDDLKKLKDQFTELKAQPTTRKVRVYYNSCCNCGCDDILVEREVPMNDPLKDGDKIYDYQNGDQLVEEDDE